MPHRFASDGFDHPTVYCREMIALIAHAKQRVRKVPSKVVAELPAHDQRLMVSHDDLAVFDRPDEGRGFIANLRDVWAERALPDFEEALELAAKEEAGVSSRVAEILQTDRPVRGNLAIQPSVVLWTAVTRQAAAGVTAKSIDGKAIGSQPEYVHQLSNWTRNGLPPAPRLHRSDAWLRLPFGDRIEFEADTAQGEAFKLVNQALEIIGDWDCATLDEIYWLSPEIQFIRDPMHTPTKLSLSATTRCQAPFTFLSGAGAAGLDAMIWPTPLSTNSVTRSSICFKRVSPLSPLMPLWSAHRGVTISVRQAVSSTPFSCFAGCCSSGDTFASQQNRVSQSMRGRKFSECRPN